LSGLIVGVSVGVSISLAAGQDVGIFYGVIAGLHSRMKSRKIEPAEALTWSGAKSRRSLIAGSIVATLCGLLIGSFLGVANGVAFGLIMILGIILIQGYLPTIADERNIATPNEGIWRSLRHAVLAGMACGLIGGLASWTALVFNIKLGSPQVNFFGALY
jgi:hypothetical protein